MTDNPALRNRLLAAAEYYAQAYMMLSDACGDDTAKLLREAAEALAEREAAQGEAVGPEAEESAVQDQEWWEF